MIRKRHRGDGEHEQCRALISGMQVWRCKKGTWMDGDGDGDSGGGVEAEA